MKTSFEHLPPSSREELSVLRALTLRFVPQCRMMILFGSYAHDNYILWEESIAFGRRRLYRSDYEILVVIDGGKNEAERICRLLHDRVTEYYHRFFRDRRHAAPRFVVEPAAVVSEQIKQGNYFFTVTVQNGILLYDDRRYALPEASRNVSGKVGQRAETEFESYYPRAVELVGSVTSRLLPKDDYRHSALRLHEACEKFYAAILAVHANYVPRNLPLDVLAGLAKRFSREIDTVFPKNNDFETTSYRLLCRAPEETRRPIYRYTRERLGYMLRGTELLGTITRKLCAERIAHDCELTSSRNKTQAGAAGVSAKN